MTPRLGRRAIINGSKEWVELGRDEVDLIIGQTADYNLRIFRLCWSRALEAAGAKTDGDKASCALDPRMRAEVLSLATAFFERLGISGFTALKNTLEEKINVLKLQAAVGP